MRTRARIRGEEEETPVGATTARSPSNRASARAPMRANSSLTGKGSSQSMLQGGSSTATTGGSSSSTADSPAVNRKRTSASQGRKETVAAAAAVSTAAPTKQRRITRKEAAAAVKEEEDVAGPSTAPTHSGGAEHRELKHLTDYYPDAKTEEGSRRVTRAQHRTVNSVSPKPPPVTESMEGANQTKKVATTGGSRTQSGRVTKKGSTSKGEESSGQFGYTLPRRVAARPSSDPPAAGPSAAIASTSAAPANSNVAGFRDSPFRLILGPRDEMDANLMGNDHAAIAQFIQAQYDGLRQHADGTGGPSGAANAAARRPFQYFDFPPHSAAASSSAGASSSSALAPTSSDRTAMLLEHMSAAHGQASSAGGSAAASRGGARSAASNFIGNLVPRMQHLLGGNREGAQGTNPTLSSLLHALGRNGAGGGAAGAGGVAGPLPAHANQLQQQMQQLAALQQQQQQQVAALAALQQQQQALQQQQVQAAAHQMGGFGSQLYGNFPMYPPQYVVPPSVIQLPAQQMYNAQQQLRMFQQQQQQPPPPQIPLQYVMQPTQPPPQPYLYQPHQSVIVRQDAGHPHAPAPGPSNLMAADYCWPYPGTSTSAIPDPSSMQQMQQAVSAAAPPCIYGPVRTQVHQQQVPGRALDAAGALGFFPEGEEDDDEAMGMRAGRRQRDGEEPMDTNEGAEEDLMRKQRDLMALIDIQRARRARDERGGGLYGGLGGMGGGAIAAMRTSDARVQTILEGLKSSNEIRQQEAAIELADLLLMGNEDSLPPNLPIREIVSMVVQLLQKEHNFELMLTAARCLTNMLEALPRAQPVVIEAVPYLLEKLKRIECIDVAEQSLAALEVMSRRNGKNIMAAGGIAATISHIDFFPLASQRLAFSIASNCALFVSHADFHLVRDSLAELTQRMINGACAEDKRCLDSICTLFARLIENLRAHPDKLREVAGSNHTLLSNMQQLLLAQPSLLSSQTFPLVVKSVRTMAAKCSDIAVALIDNHFATTLRQLFVGHAKNDGNEGAVDIVSRPANQLAELVFLTGELFPRLPTSGIFEIDAVAAGCNRDNASGAKPAIGAEWFWRDDDGMWQSYRTSESRMLETARAAGHSETHLSAGGNVYLMELTNMRQTNTLTGTTRELMRRAPNPPPAAAKKDETSTSSSSEEDARLVKVQSDGAKMESVARLLFPVLVEIDGSSVGPSLRYESLRVMLRIVCPTPSGVLRGVLADLPLSGHIASALASQRSKDVCVVVAALQLVHMLMEKMADVYGPLFRKEGVSHEVAKLAAMSLSSSTEGSPSSTGSAAAAGPSSSKSAPPSGVASPALGTSDAAGGSKRGTATRRATKSKQPEDAATSSAAAAAPTADASSSSSTSTAPVTRSNRQRKRNSPDASPSSSNKEKSRRKSSSSTFLSALRLPSFRGSPSSSASPANGSPSSSTATTAVAGAGSISSPSSSSVASSNSAARAELSAIYSQYSSQLSAASSRRAAATAAAGTAAGSVQLSSGQKEKMRAWIKKEAELLMKTYFGEGVGSSSSSMEALEECGGRLEWREERAVEALYALLQKEQLSAFEMKQSGLIAGLHTYLTIVDGGPGGEADRRKRLATFARVFMKIDVKNGEQMRPTGIDGSFEVFEALVQKTLASVSLLEQFQVSDMGGIATGGVGGCLRGAQALRFFQTHQIRCNLRRHPACRDLSDWRHGHGSIKVDPLTSISAIERYLSDRGIGYVRNSASGAAGAMEDSSGEDELSDEDGEGGVMGGAAAINGAAGGEEKKIEIVIGDTSLPGSISILQALRQYSPLMQEEGGGGGAIGQSLWMSTHTLYYRSVVPKEDSTQGSSPSAHSPNASTPLSTSPSAPVLKDRKQKVADKMWIEGEVEAIESPLWSLLQPELPVDMEDPCASSLLLLRALYGLNKYWYALFDMDAMLPSTFTPIIPISSFVCSKLAAKLQRQLSDFLSVATQQIPKWTTDLVKATPFIFPFAMRRSLLYCTAFGRDRALMHLVNSTDGGGGADSHDTGRGLTPRLERKKVSIKRDDLIKSAEAALLGCSGGHRAMLEVSFEGEAGTGFGPTLEFYSAISKELQQASLKLWSGTVVKGVGDDSEVEYVSAPYGLHPNAVPYGLKSSGGSSRVKKFELIGRLMAQSLIDARMLDLPLSPLFHAWLTGDQARIGLPELEMLDPQLYKSLRALSLTDESDFEHLEQYFTLPGNESFELVKGGKNKPVTKANCMQYIKLVVRWRLREGVAREMEAMRRGFCSIVDSTHLSIFTADELDQLFCGCPDDAGDKVWGAASIAAAIKPDHGYSHDSEQIKWLVQMLSSFNKEEQRRFIQFCTGSPRLPVGGFRALNPPLTIVRKSPAYGSSDEELPSAMTCYNYLKVPPYSSYEIFFERFSVALQFVTSFHLT